MNFIKQIEKALKAINEARFQDLINHLLHVQGNSFIGAPGSVVGKEKTSKGIPDSFFVNGNNKFVFVECTTLEKLPNHKAFLLKLECDIDNCFDEQKTKIKREDIQKVILAFTSKISPEDFNRLKDKVRNYNRRSTLETLNIQNLPLQIYDFPGLAKQYLGVDILKGEIYNLADFLIKTTKSLQPSLTNQFIGRDDELKEGLDLLESADILLLTGNAGVGKSKLAIQILTEKENSGHAPIVIQSSAIPLWDDFVHLFQNDKKYIILFDDANKSVQNLSYLLNFIQRPKTNRLKLVITCRDYVKDKVLESLNDFKYAELVVGKLKDNVIGEIIVKALPNLQYHPEIKRKIIDLSKGNARVSLMATYSVSPDSETNYLKTPVLLYEKYFSKIAKEIEAFSKPLTLQALAIVSFFGVLDRNNNEIKAILENEFEIGWNDLWDSILELHANEVLDVYSNEVAKVSDQVLAIFSFYKCFIDEKSTVIDYGDWILMFMERYSSRIKNTLIDANNTFNYHHIKKLVITHLEKVISYQSNNQFLYSFHSIFWFYKIYDTLIFVRQWVQELPVESQNGELEFTYVHNNHTKPTKYFDLLVNFWNFSNELLKPSIELGIELVAKQIGRLPEFLKFINDSFSYKLEDTGNKYERQFVLTEVLLNEKRSALHQRIANGTFLNIAKTLLGWHFTEYVSKGKEFSIYNFNLVDSSELSGLRIKILEGVYSLWSNDVKQENKILEKLVFPGGDVPQEIYETEFPFYNKLITDKLSVRQYAHCHFVKKMAGRIYSNEADIPYGWRLFIDSEILQLLKLLKPGFEERKGKSSLQLQEEKREEIQNWIASKDWSEIEPLIYLIDEICKQQNTESLWFIDSGISEIFMAIAIKSRSELINALRIFWGGKVSIRMHTMVINFILDRNILTGNELFQVLNDYEFSGKPEWILSILTALPIDQIDLTSVEILINTFKGSQEVLPIYKMSEFLKYNEVFNIYKAKFGDDRLETHNLISYITEILLSKQNEQKINLGFHFCQECCQYFSNHLRLLKGGFFYLRKHDQHFDYDGKEFEAVFEMDNSFLFELFETIDHNDYEFFHAREFRFQCVWATSAYKEIIDKAMEIIIKRSPVYSNFEYPSAVLFPPDSDNREQLQKAYDVIEDFIDIHYTDIQKSMMIMNIVLHKYPAQFLKFLKQFLMLNKSVQSFKKIWLDRSLTYSGSRVPYIQRQIDFCDEIVIMIKSLPDILDYADHVSYMEQKIHLLNKEMDHEKRRDFEDLEE